MIWWLAQGFLVSALLAGIVWAAGRCGRMPATVRHLLWLVVLVKLLMPPIVAWPWKLVPLETAIVAAQSKANTGTLERVRRWLLEEESLPRSMVTSASLAADPGKGSSVLPAATPPAETSLPPIAAQQSFAAPASMTPSLTPQRAILFFLLLGGTAYACLQTYRIAKLRHLVSRGTVADHALTNRVQSLASQMKIKPPAILTLNGIDGPYIVSILRPTLLWPANLLADDSLITHELAHLKRRDHWTGWLELAASILWWWSPIYWLARRELRADAELACDAWVVQLLPQSRRTYAHTLLNICERQSTRTMPAIALGVRSGKRELQTRLIQIVQGPPASRVPAAMLAATLFMLAAAIPAWSAGSGPAPKLPFTVGKETTVITSPLKADGTPDYLAALNEKYGKGVTPETNGFVLWIEKVGGTRVEDGALIPRVTESVLKLAGAKPTPADARTWMVYQAYLTNEKHLDAAAAREAIDNDEVAAARRKLWAATDNQKLADYLKFQEQILAIVAEVANRPKWYSPAVGENMLDVMLPSLGGLRDVCNVLSARATLRANSGDFDGCMADIATIKKFARHLASGSTVIERVVAYTTNRLSDDVVATVAASGKLSEAQATALLNALNAFPPLPGPDESIDTFERWSQLDLIVRAARDPATFREAALLMHATELPADGVAAPETKDFVSLDAAKVDWNAALRLANQTMDQQLRLAHASGIAARKILAAEWQNTKKQWEDQFKHEPTMKIGPDETQEAYTRRVAQGLMSQFMPTLDRISDIYDEAVMVDQMARALVVLARMKAHDGAWPQTIPPRPLLPIDIYSFTGLDTVLYMVTPAGPRVYSVGRNMKDDHGIRDGKADDIGLGSPAPAPPQTPAGLP